MTVAVAAIVAATLASPRVAVPTAADITGKRSVGAHMREDLRQLASVPALVILATGGAAALAIAPHDGAVERRIGDARSLDRAVDAGNTVGDGYVQVGAAAATWILGRAVRSRSLAALGGELLEAQLLNGALTRGIKAAVDRERPSGGHDGFPSGHTSATFATAAVLQHRYGWKAGVPGYALGAYVATARLGERQHYPSDVLFGAALGIVAGRAVSVAHARHSRLTMTVVPVSRGFVLVISRHAAEGR